MGVLSIVLFLVGVVFMSIFSLSGYMWPSGGHPGGPSLVSMGSAHPQSLEPPSGRRTGGPLRPHCKLVREGIGAHPRSVEL